MTKELLHPELGSGALREALEKAVGALDLAITMHDKAGCSGETCSYPYDLQKMVRTACRAALSLSSPIEPEDHGGKEYLQATGLAPTMQASSGVRERELIAKWRKQPSHQDTMPLSEAAQAIVFARSLCADELEEALAPSRQGAGGK